MPLLSALAVLLLAAAAAASGSPKHILFVMVDDLGFNDVSYRNTSDLSSPNIDALALAGLRLERYYTHNLCSPSRTAFLSGRYASTLSMQGCVIINGHAVDLPRNVSTVADRLSEGGFKTAAFGKWDAGMTTWDYTPTCRGFDYFYGYWNAAQDYYSHGAPVLDLHENFETDFTQHGVYSTNLYTSKARAWVQKTLGAEKADKSFLYMAYQAMHGPIEAPVKYVNTPHCRGVTSENKRNIYCGMMACLDEGIGNLTSTYQALGAWADTLLVLAADNGGHVGSSGNNAPLRGEKSTNFEGGVRAVGFLHWPGLAPELRGSVSHDVVHVSDWLPTFVQGVAGLGLKADTFRYALDGVDQWLALTQPALAGGPARGNATGLVHEIGGDNGIRQESYMQGRYKIIRFHATIYNNDKFVCANYTCPYGWNPLPGPGVQPESPPDQRTNGTWLFDVFADPLEHHDLSLQLPDVVERMVAALAKLSARPGCSWDEQTDCAVDPLYMQAVKDANHTATPWRGSRSPTCSAGGSNAQCGASGPPPGPSPPPGPPLPGPPEGTLDGVQDLGGGRCSVSGWCSGAHFSGPPRQVRLTLDGAQHVVASGTAAVSRPKAGRHGFELPLSCSMLAAGSHRLYAQCRLDAQGQWLNLEHSPRCFKDGTTSACQ